VTIHTDVQAYECTSVSLISLCENDASSCWIKEFLVYNTDLYCYDQNFEETSKTMSILRAHARGLCNRIKDDMESGFLQNVFRLKYECLIFDTINTVKQLFTNRQSYSLYKNNLWRFTQTFKHTNALLFL
jgi:hypothetical protein